MSDKIIQNCDVRFQFLCPKKWQALLPTADPDIRGCEACARLVYLCNSPEQAREHARQGRCVALVAPPGAHRDAPAIDPLATIDPLLIKLLPRDVAEKHRLIPVSRSGPALTVAMADPSNLLARDDVAFITGFHVTPVAALEADILRAIKDHYGEEREVLLGVIAPEHGGDDEDEDEAETHEEDAPIVKLVNVILANSIKKNAARVNLRWDDVSFVVWFEVDGAEVQEMKPPLKLQRAVLARIRRMADLPGDGQGVLRFKGAGKRAEVFLVSCRAADRQVILERSPR